MKIKSSLTLPCVLCLALIFSNNIFAGTYSGGTGEQNDPYQIATAEDLNDVGNHPEDFNKSFIMVADINLAAYTGTQFNAIGKPPNDPFTGVFDGNGRSIYNFTYEPNEPGYSGLFNLVDGTLKDITLVDCVINDSGAADSWMILGSLVGLSSGIVSDCHAKGIVTGHRSTGGLVGCNMGIVNNCSSDIEITAIGSGDMHNQSYYLGGLVGFNPYGGLVYNCHSDGNVIGIAIPHVGGLVGYNYPNSVVDASFSRCNVSGVWEVGGLVGTNNGGTIRRCYSKGSVSGSDYVGGLVGYNVQALIDKCYSNGDVSGTGYYVGGLIGLCYSTRVETCFSTGIVSGGSALIGWTLQATIVDSFWDSEINPTLPGIGYGVIDLNAVGLTTRKMQQKTTFTNWDFIETWGIEDNQTYPFLRLTYPVGDIDLDKKVDFIDFAIFANHWLEDKGQ